MAYFGNKQPEALPVEGGSIFDTMLSQENQYARELLAKENPMLSAWMAQKEQEYGQPYSTEDYLRAATGLTQDEPIPAGRELQGMVHRGLVETIPWMIPGGGFLQGAARVGTGAGAALPARASALAVDPRVSSEDPATSMLIGGAIPILAPLFGKLGGKIFQKFNKGKGGTPMPPGGGGAAPSVPRTPPRFPGAAPGRGMMPPMEAEMGNLASGPPVFQELPQDSRMVRIFEDRLRAWKEAQQTAAQSIESRGPSSLSRAGDILRRFRKGFDDGTGGTPAVLPESPRFPTSPPGRGMLPPFEGETGGWATRFPQGTVGTTASFEKGLVPPDLEGRLLPPGKLKGPARTPGKPKRIRPSKFGEPPVHPMDMKPHPLGDPSDLIRVLDQRHGYTPEEKEFFSLWYQFMDPNNSEKAILNAFDQMPSVRQRKFLQWANSGRGVGTPGRLVKHPAVERFEKFKKYQRDKRIGPENKQKAQDFINEIEDTRKNLGMKSMFPADKRTGPPPNPRDYKHPFDWDDDFDEWLNNVDFESMDPDLRKKVEAFELFANIEGPPHFTDKFDKYIRKYDDLFGGTSGGQGVTPPPLPKVQAPKDALGEKGFAGIPDPPKLGKNQDILDWSRSFSEWHSALDKEYNSRGFAPEQTGWWMDLEDLVTRADQELSQVAKSDEVTARNILKKFYRELHGLKIPGPKVDLLAATQPPAKSAVGVTKKLLALEKRQNITIDDLAKLQKLKSTKVAFDKNSNIVGVTYKGQVYMFNKSGDHFIYIGKKKA
jgi:hypothetical protein